MFYFKREDLLAKAETLKPEWDASEPFKHVVIDNFLPTDIATKIAESFPGLEDIDWRFVGPGDSKHTNNKNVEKVSCPDEQQFPDDIRQVIHCLQSGIFLKFLEKVTGFEHLAPDPYHFGGGLHSTGTGGRLMVHVDASRHPNSDYQQIANLIYYCTPDWKEEYGGHLELWDKKSKTCKKKVAPLFNRAVLFYTGKESLHGQPNPVTAPGDLRRNSIALYFYSTKKHQSNLEYTNFVQWHHVTSHDKQSMLHVLKRGLRATLPSKLVNQIATNVRRFKK